MLNFQSIEDKLLILSKKGQNISCNLESENQSENSLSFSDFQILTKKKPIFYLMNNNNNFSSESTIKQIEKEQINIIKKNKTSINPKFIVIKEEFKERNFSKELNKKIGKRGRKKNNVSKRNNKIHKPDSADNILRKVHVHFLSFIVSYLNDILKYLGYKQKFLNLDYAFKVKADKATIKELQNTSIGLIISNKRSDKYIGKNINHNKLLYEEIKDKEIIGKILSEKYLILFKKVYYRNNIIINLKEYGLEEKVKLSNNVKTYRDLLLKKNVKEINKRDFTKCIKRHFIPESIFLINE